jgi:uncharacterized protein with FMN-binding domain
VRTRAVLSSIFASVSILIVGAQLGSAATATTAKSTTTGTGAADAGTTGTGTTGTGSTGTGSTTSSSATPTPSSSASATSASKDGKFTGDTVGTQFGNVQVAVTISGGKITDVTPLQLTNDGGRSVQISNRAAPILRSEVLQSQSASVSNVSGATYTTEAYLTSLQSALDQAGF